MMKNGEYVYVKSYFCESTEDDYEKGLIGCGCSYWDDRGGSICKKRFESIEDALRGVLEENGFKWTGMENWCNRFRDIGEESERGCFEFSTLVDEDNCEAEDSQIEAWKRGKRPLWNCDVVVRLGVRVEREFTDEEI